MATTIVGHETAELAVAALRQEWPEYAAEIDADAVAECECCGKWYDAEEEMASLGGDHWVTGRDGTQALAAYPACCIPCQEEGLREMGFMS